MLNVFNQMLRDLWLLFVACVCGGLKCSNKHGRHTTAAGHVIGVSVAVACHSSVAHTSDDQAIDVRRRG